MRLSLNFVKEYVQLPDVTPKDVATALTVSTVEVDESIEQQQLLGGVVVGRVTEVVKHPQADRLWVCRVDIKTEELQIICGGTNVVKGMYAAIAKVGSKVRWHGEGVPITLEKAKIRGVESNGMIASSVELGLEKLFPAKSDREIMDLSQYQVRVGDPLAKALGLTDTIFVIDNKSMTNRPDLWGQYGLAREIAAIYNAKLKPFKVSQIPAPQGPALPLTVEVTDQKLCPRYAAIVIDNIAPAPSPWWLKRDLEEAGINPINVIVDVTNYVMLTMGQPMHAFDYEKIRSEKIVVAPLDSASKFDALNAKTYEVPAGTLMIRDGTEPVAIAGIIGGSNSHLTEKTKTIVLESANFNASSIRRSEVAMGVRTEASSRFEKKLDPALVPEALAYAVELLLELAPGAQIASKVLDVNSAEPQTPTITVEKKYLDSRLGKTIDAKEISAILKRLAFGVSYRGGVYTVSVPSFRGRDVVAPEDVVEEVARIYGYNNIEPQLPTMLMANPERNPQSRVARVVRRALTTGCDYSEVYTYSFEDPVWAREFDHTRNRVAVANALTPDQMYLRMSLLPGLMAKVIENLRWYSEFKVFEMGRVFSKNPGEFAVDASGDSFLPNQPLMVAGMAVAKTDDVSALLRKVRGELDALFCQLNIPSLYKEAKMQFADATLEIRSHNAVIGHIGILKQGLGSQELKNRKLVWWKLEMDHLVKFADFTREYEPPSKFPSIVRDIAIVVDQGVRWDAIAQSLAHVSPLVQFIELFDVFSSVKLGENKKSIAFSITFASNERTLESAEVDKIVAKIVRMLEELFVAQVR